MGTRFWGKRGLFEMVSQSEKGVPTLRGESAKYAVAVVAAFGLCLAVPALSGAPLVLFVFAVALTSQYGGYRPAIVATLLSIAASSYLLWPAFHAHPSQAWTLAVFAAVSAILARQAVAQRGAERARAATEEGFRSVITDAPIPILVHTEEGEILAMSHAFARITGYTLEDIPNAEAWLRKACGVPEDKLTEARRTLSAKYRSVSRYAKEEQRVRCRNGEERTWIIHASQPSEFADGRRVMASMAVDITERQRAEEALRNDRERLRLVLSQVPAKIWTTDRDLRITSMEGGRTLAGWDPTAAIGTTLHERAAGRGEDYRPLPAHRQALAGEAVEYEHTPSGTGRTIAARVQPLRDAHGAIVGTIGVGLDVTDRKRAEEALRESQQDLKRAQAVAQTGSWRMDVRRNELWWSDEAYRIFGIPKGTPLTYETFLASVYEEDREEVDRRWSAALSGDEPYDIEHRIVADSQVKWVRERAELEFDEQGTLLGGFGTVQDVTERKVADEKLRKALDTLHQTFESISDGFFSLDRRWRFTYVNRTGARMMGMDPEELLGQVIWDLFPHAFTRRFHKEYRQAMETSTPLHFEEYYPEPLEAWFECHCYPSPDGLSVYFQDITDRKRADEALREREREYRTLAENSPEVIARFDRDLRHTYVNEYGARLYGLPREQILGKTAAELDMPADKVALWQRHFREVLASGEQQTVEFEYHDDDLGHRYFSSLLVPEFGPAGEVTSLLAITRDVTPEKKAEAALRAEKERFQTLFRSMTEGFAMAEIIRDDEGRAVDYRYIEVNDAFGRLAGCPPSRIVGMRASELNPHLDRFWPETYGRVALTGQPAQFQRYSTTFGRWLEVFAFGAGPDRFGSLIVDITDRIRFEEELRALNETLERRVLERTRELERSYEALRQSERLAALGQAMAALSHESRNAVQNCLAALQMLRRLVGEDPKQLKYVQMALKSLDNLRAAYEDIREYAAPMRLERAPTALAEVWRDTWTDLASRLVERDVRLVEVCEATDLDCEADAPRLKQVFRNLVENSLDACPDPVEITIACKDDQLEGRPALRVAVRDNGPGLDKAEAGRVLEAFYTTKPKGTGLGLAIVQRIVEAHGGRVTAGPANGGGFEVVVLLPRQAHCET